MSGIGHIIAEAALGYRGTPFRHQGRRPGVGLDCAGVALCAAWSAGLQVPDFAVYGTPPDSEMLLGKLDENCERVEPGAELPGDVALFAFRVQRPTHMAVLTGGDRMVHAWEPHGRVLWVPMGQSWANRLCGFWRFRGAV